ncbi:MAG: hypothetical protein K8T20_11485 [Planctomycetes bacterium]|nr:hypothetical protein [Planctomycetota bacterium]
MLFASSLSANFAQAHEKWLIPREEVRRLQGEELPGPFRHFFPFLALALTGAVILVGVGVAFDAFLRRRRFGEKICRQLLARRAVAPPLVGIATGVVLILAGATRTFIAPDLSLDLAVPHGAATALAVAQVVLGAAFVAGFFTRAAALSLLVLYLPAAALFGFRSWLDYIDVVGFALYLALVGRGALSVDALRGAAPASPSAERSGVAILRVILGLNLAILAVNNKLMNPLVSMKLVGDYHLNFPQNVGVKFFTDAHYVLSAAAVELAIGVLLVVGALPRLLALAVFGLLITTFVIFGFPELFGHLPILAGGIAVLLMGTGGKFKVARVRSEISAAAATA